jgi:hypothetical protein
MTKNSRDLPKTLFETAKRFFDGIGNSPKLKEHLAKADQVAQFAPKDGEPFFVRVQAGALQFGNGKQYPEGDQESLYIIEVENSLDALFKGDITLGEAIFYQKIRIPGYRNKEPAIARFSRLLRLGIWDLVSGSRLLMPTK